MDIVPGKLYLSRKTLKKALEIGAILVVTLSSVEQMMGFTRDTGGIGA